MQTWMNLDVLALVMGLFNSMENLDVFGILLILHCSIRIVLFIVLLNCR
jgi:hypothetical protein